MFIAILTYKKLLSEVDRFLAAHRDYLAKHYAAGDFITSLDVVQAMGGSLSVKCSIKEDCQTIIRLAEELNLPVGTSLDKRTK